MDWVVVSIAGAIGMVWIWIIKVLYDYVTGKRVQTAATANPAALKPRFAATAPRKPVADAPRADLPRMESSRKERQTKDSRAPI